MQIDAETAILLDAVLPHAGFDGWTAKTLRQALADLGRAPEEAPLLFAGMGDMIEASFALADQRMVAGAAGLEGGLTARVRAIIALRLGQMEGQKEATRRALARLTLPFEAPRLARIIARGADSIWFAAGDHSADFAWYTKRASLGAIWLAILLYWLGDDSADSEATLAFLSRRLAGSARLGKFRHGLQEKLARFIPRRAQPASGL